MNGADSALQIKYSRLLGTEADQLENTELLKSVDSEKGASMLEYALLAALIAVVAIGAVTLLGGKVASKFSTVASTIG